MSCDNSIPLETIVDQIKASLAPYFIMQDNPTIVNGVFTTPVLNSPSIRGDLVLDTDARIALRAATRPVTIPKIIGSRSEGDALVSLLQALASIGVIVDNTTT